MAKQSSIKTTTWADQAQGFAFPSKQHTARGRKNGDVTAAALHSHGNTGGYGNRYASLDESRSSVRDTTPSQDDSNRPYRDNGKAPIPINDKKASVKIALGMANVSVTNTTPRVFGSICRRIK